MFEIKIDGKLSLKLLTLKDSANLFKLVEKNRKYLREWMPWVDMTQSKSDTENFIRISLMQFANNKGPQCGIMVDGVLAGVIGVHPIDSANQKTLLGYWLGEQFTGYGVITECCRKLITYIFQEHNVNKISIRAALDNIRSRAVAERLGFISEGVLRENERVSKRFVDHAVYSILKREWYG